MKIEEQVAERSRDALCLSAVNFNSKIRRAQSSVLVTSASDLPLVVINKDSLTRDGVCGKLHGQLSQFRSHSTTHRSIASYSSRKLFPPTPPAFNAQLGGPRRNIATTFGMQKLEWFGYPTLKKFWKIYLFVLTESTNMTDRQM